MQSSTLSGTCSSISVATNPGATVLLDHLGHGAPAVLSRGDVALVDAAFQALLCELADKRFGRFAVPAVTGGDVRALLGEAVKDRTADTAGAAGHKGNAAVQTWAMNQRFRARADRC